MISMLSFLKRKDYLNAFWINMKLIHLLAVVKRGKLSVAFAVGHYFTYYSKQKADSRVWSKINRVIINCVAISFDGIFFC